MSDDIAAKLAAPFPPDVVEWRVGPTNKDKTRGQALCYIDARAVMNRLDEVCGVFGWQSEHTIVDKRTICKLSLRNPETGEWISRTDGCGDTDVEAEKGSLSDSLKRAAVNFGIGRYLYDTDCPWVEIEPAGRSYKIADKERPRLAALIGGRVERPTAARAPAAIQRSAPRPAPDKPVEGQYLPDAAEPSHITKSRDEAKRLFFERASYRVDPALTTIMKWDAMTLGLYRYAAQHCSLAQFEKLQEDTRNDQLDWEKHVAAPVVEHFNKTVADAKNELHRRLLRSMPTETNGTAV